MQRKPDLTAISGLICDKAGSPLLLAHRTNTAFDDLDPTKTIDGGLHFGTLEQATMRAGKNSRLILAYLRAPNLRRSKDRGGDWKSIIGSAKRAGMDGIVYLNRYEGMTTEIIERLRDSGDLQRLDGMSDAQFKKLVPEAMESYIVFSADQILVQSEQ